MHIRRGERDIAEARGLESTAVGIFVGDCKSPKVERRLVLADARVVKALVREIRPRMTAPAAASALIEPQAVPLVF